MKWSREWVSVRASIGLTFAVALLSIVVGLLHISGFSVQGPLSPYIPDIVRRTVGFTGTITGFSMLGSGFALKRGYRVGWYTTAVLLPLTAIQGLMQVSVFSLPLVVLSVVSVPALVFNRGRFDRSYSPSPTQLAAGAALASAIAYGTVGSYALRDEFDGIETIVDAFYFTVVTASTVGYGDITPETGTSSDIAQLFVLSSLVMNVAAFAVALGVLLTPAIEAQLSKALGKMTEKQFDLLSDHVLVLGYGELTEPILEQLADRDVVHAVVTADESAARALGERDVPVLTADPSDVEPLERSHVEDARAVIVATTDDARDALAILTARQLAPDVRIVAAATQRENVDKLRRAGADHVISPATLGGHLLVGTAFETNGRRTPGPAQDD
ncbi:potassium channel protein [Halorubrum sp. JWXQ-INN 858]|uniref:NAD-binding protein n=1 Tax=Halorubrum sp. JWXQ-INN 858 TaxID=2690782 RepID=UPI00135AE7BF|nr:NAD-binding protein [Halorubrum sp. JWXQ-INN 858]MWV63242.1 potassium channel protein [Halorubrum sp. JWXQ-INN 858]